MTEHQNHTMNINAIKESKYLTRNDVGTGIEVTIKSIAQANVAMEGESPDLKYVLHFAESIKPMVLKSTNAQLIAAVLKSEETDDWIGKRVCLYDDPTVSFAGKLVGGIRVRASSHAVPPAQAKSITATEKTRLWALNLLMAAPGQTNRDFVTKYFRAHGMIGPEEEPEAWRLADVPTSKAAVQALADQITNWADDVPF